MVLLESKKKLQQNFLICQALKATWAEFREREHTSIILHCRVKARNKKSLQNLLQKGPTADNTKETEYMQKDGHPWVHNPEPTLWQSTIHPTTHFDQLCHCCNYNLWVLLHDFCCSLLAAHHKPLPVGTGHWALPSCSNSRY